MLTRTTETGSRRNSSGAPEGTAPSGTRIGRYDLLGEIARGGYSVVYRARDRSLGTLVALKRLHVEDRAHATLLEEAFEREYQVLKGLTHPRIIRVFDYGVTREGAYYTMELLEGDDLRSTEGVDWREACQHLRDVATSLSLLHARRLVHRDLSPSNVKRSGDGHCKLIDFGALSEFGQTDVIVGTPPFVAPEAWTRGQLDQGTDLYALGALGYYCLTGRHAYPAQRHEDLPRAWQQPPPKPSSLRSDVPRELDDVVMSLLSQDAHARPASAAEVILRLDAIGNLPAEDDASQRVLAQSFLAAPRYVGRKEPLKLLNAALRAATLGAGSAIRVVAASGMGRTRMLEEIAVRAEVAGAVVARADASAQRGRFGAVRALAVSLLDGMPDVAQRLASEHARALASMGLDLERRRKSWPTSAARTDRPPAQETSKHQDTSSSVEEWLVAVSRERPVVLLVDNVECADDASISALIALSRAAPGARLLVVLTEQTDNPDARGFGFATLQAASEAVRLYSFSPQETVELMRSLFGETSRLERFAEWVHAETAGCPLHALDMVRRWVAHGVVCNERGTWVLPSARPQTELAEVLEDALARRIDALSEDARGLAQCLSLHRVDSTLALCRRLVRSDAGRGVLSLLDELAASDVLRRGHEHYFFSSAALRQTVLNRMGAGGRRATHLRLGVALTELAEREGDNGMRMDAGWHLIRGGDELRGADIIAEVAKDSVACNVLVANLYRMGEPVEAALRVYRDARKSERERLPLLTALAQAGYYEHYRWADLYGDEALDAVERFSGLGAARRLRPVLGRHLGFLLAFGVAALRHYLHPRSVRGGSFINLLVHVCCTVTALCGVAAMRLNGDRCEQVARVLEPSSVLPRRVALVGIYRFCVGLQHVAREHQAQAFARFDEMAANFKDPKYYWFMPPETHVIYTAGCHFARGAFGMMRASGVAALESAAVLERMNLPLYTMIASQIRYLYHLNRGEPEAAQKHRERVEVHAARVGSAWQVELWEPASLIPYGLVTLDLLELARLSHRLEQLSESAPSLWRYRDLAQLASWVQYGASELFERVLVHLEVEPRSFIGWSTSLGATAMHKNFIGDHACARELCERALTTMTDEDRACTMIFLLVDTQAALADAGLGRFEAALARVDRLLELHTPSNNALVLGLVHEARARVAWAAGERALYEDSLRQATSWLRGTGVPALAAMSNRLAVLSETTQSAPDTADELTATPSEPRTRLLRTRARKEGEDRTPS